jgi:hypothetical protein
MKKFLILFIACLTFFGCGDDVTNINGYTDEQVQAKIDSTLGAQDVVLMTDTVYQQTVDTIYNMVIDTVTNELVDTIYQRVVDTVTNELVDTIYQRVVDTVMTELVDTIYNRVVDTVYKELVDTIYQKVIDTVFTELEKVGVDITKPRDTSITLYDTTDGIITAKIYKGVVYKNVFYEAHEYPLGMPVTYYNGGANNKMFRFPDSYFKVEDYAYEMNCSGACGIKGQVHLTFQCGEISKPDYNGRAYKDDKLIKKFDGWRLFDATDAYDMAQYLNMVVSDTTLVYLSTISYDATTYYGAYSATVAKYRVPSTIATDADKWNIKYVCAYDLK